MRKWILGIVVLMVVALILAIILRTPEASPREVREASSKTPSTATPEAPPVPTRTTETPAPVAPAPSSPGRVWGRVLQPDGHPAVGVEIQIAWSVSERQPPLEEAEGEPPAPDAGPATTDGEGRFSIEAVPRGEVVLSARHETGTAVDRLRVTAHQPLHDITLILRGGQDLSGIVVGRGGQGIAGATVMPLILDGRRQFQYQSEGRAVTSSDDGRFRLQSLDPGEWTLFASAEGYGSVLTEAFPTGIENARIVLSDGAVLPCIVVREGDGSPVADVTVTLAYAEEELEPARAVSDASGALRFDSVGMGDYLLDLEDSRFALVGLPVAVSINPTRKSEVVTLHVSEGGEIRGHLLDGTTGEGISGVVMRAYHDERERVFYSVATDGAGAYILSGLPPGTYKVEPPARMPDYPQDPLQPPEERVTLSTGQVLEGIDFTLTAGASLAGVVLDSAGNPVEGATVRANAVEGRQNMAEFFTAADGRFQFGDYQEGEVVELVAETRSARSGLTGPHVAGAPESAEIELRLALDCSGVIGGRVVDGRGEPFPCKVMAIAADDALQFPVRWPTGNTDGGGNFVLPEVCAGTYTLHLVPRSNARQEAQTVTVGPGEAVLGLSLVYDQGELLELSGVVEDVEGRPVAGARVSASFSEGQSRFPGASATADEEGEFTFRGLTAGDYVVSARAEGYSHSEDVAAIAGETDVVVAMVRAPRVSGAVVGAGGAPVGAFTISVVNAGNRERESAIKRFADASGSFTTTLPGQGHWILRVEAEGYKPVEVDLGRVSEEEEVSEIAVTLEGEL